MEALKNKIDSIRKLLEINKKLSDARKAIPDFEDFQRSYLILKRKLTRFF